MRYRELVILAFLSTAGCGKSGHDLSRPADSSSAALSDAGASDAGGVDADRASADLDAGHVDATNENSDSLARKEKDKCMNHEVDAIAERDANKLIAALFAMGHNWHPEDFVVVDAIDRRDLPPNRWMGEMFNPDANPQVMTPAPRISLHKSVDVLKFEYNFAGVRVATFEQDGGTLVRVDSPKIAQFSSMSPSERLAEVNRIGLAMFRISGASIRGACITDDVVFQPRTPSSADEVFAFSTNSSRTPAYMPQWYSRIDAGLYKGSLLFWLYHRISQRIGFGLLGPKWFPKEFREKYAPKQP